jgi:hypothetical protein
MSLKSLRYVILALVVAYSLAVGATSANAAPDRHAPAFEQTPDGITWQ